MPTMTLKQLPSGFLHPHGDAAPTARAHGTNARVPNVPGALLAFDNRHFMSKAARFYEGPSGNHCVLHLGFAAKPSEYTKESLDAVARMRREADAGLARTGTLLYECPKPIKGATTEPTEYVRHARREFAALAHDAKIDRATGKPNWTKGHAEFADWRGSNVFVFQRAAYATPGARADPTRFVALGRFAVTEDSTDTVLALRPVGPEAPPPRPPPSAAAAAAAAAALATLGAKKRPSPAPTASSTTSSPTPSAASSSIDWGDSDDDDDAAAPAKRPRSA